MNIPDLDRAKLEALEEFVICCTVPFAGKSGDERGVVGTGTLFETSDHHYIVTANHVANHLLEGRQLTVPASRHGGRSLGLGKGTIFSPTEAEWRPDIALIRLEDDELIECLREGWRFVSPENIAPIDQESEFFYVAGYPGVFAEEQEEDLETGMATIIATEFDGDTSRFELEIDDEVHLLLKHMDTGLLADGTPEKSVRLHGISGASVWSLDYDEESDEIWSPSQALKIVAVQNSYVHGTYIRATKWLVAAKVLKEMNEEAFVEVGKKLLGESV
jgi:hypothetical protein